MPGRPHSARLVRTCLAVAFLLLAAGGFPDAATAVTHTVNVADFSFTPKNLSISAGDVVRWVWVGGFHTTTNGTGPTDPAAGTLWNAPIDGDNTFFERTFNTSGTFPYFCSFHHGLGMTGTITVSGGGNSPPVIQNPGTQNGVEEQFFSVTISATDANGHSIAFSASNLPAWAELFDNGNNTASIEGTPAVGDAGTTNVTVNANDGNGGTDSESFNIVIASANIVIVELQSGGFVPSSVTIPQGHSIRWLKIAGGNHTTTNGTGPADPAAGTLWDAPLTAGSPQFTRQFNTAGSFPYFCENHTTHTGTITVNPPPSCSIGGPDPTCANTNGVVYTATVLPPGGTVSYAWGITGNGTIPGSTTGSSVSVNVGAAGSFTLTLNALRDGVPVDCSKTVTVNANPTCSIDGPDPVDPGSTGHVYSAVVLPGGGTLAYAWGITGNGTIVGGTSGSSVTVDAGAAGSYMLTLDVTRDGCPVQCQRTITVAAPTVAATIQLTGTTFTPSQVTITEGETVRWQWVDGFHTTTNGVSSDPAHNPGTLWDETIDSTTPTFDYQFNDPGYFPFFCRPHEPMGMKGVVIVEESGPTGIGDDAGLRLRLTAAPNPFTASTLLAFQLERDEKVSLDIFDIEGRLVLKLLLADLPAGRHEVRWGGWDAVHHPVAEGVYLARLVTGSGGVQVQKVLKTN